MQVLCVGMWVLRGLGSVDASSVRRHVGFERFGVSWCELRAQILLRILQQMLFGILLWMLQWMLHRILSWILLQEAPVKTLLNTFVNTLVNTLANALANTLVNTLLNILVSTIVDDRVSAFGNTLANTFLYTSRVYSSEWMMNDTQLQKQRGHHRRPLPSPEPPYQLQAGVIGRVYILYIPIYTHRYMYNLSYQLLLGSWSTLLVTGPSSLLRSSFRYFPQAAVWLPLHSQWSVIPINRMHNGFQREFGYDFDVFHHSICLYRRYSYMCSFFFKKL